MPIEGVSSSKSAQPEQASRAAKTEQVEEPKREEPKPSRKEEGVGDSVDVEA